MMVGLWDIVIGERMALAARLRGRSTASRSPRTGSSATRRPLLHLWRWRQPRAARPRRDLPVTLAPRSALLAAALLAPLVPLAPLRICRYYVMVTASIASASGTGCARARRRPGRRPRAPGEPRPRRRLAAAHPAGPRAAAAIAAVWSGSTAAGPVIYRQRRVGLGGREFEMLKLRTMVPAPTRSGVGTAVGRDDPRVTRRRALPAPRPRSTRSPTSSTSCAARWRWSARARRSPPRSTATRRASAAATR